MDYFGSFIRSTFVGTPGDSIKEEAYSNYIDNKPIEEADELLVECEAFVQATQESPQNYSFWRAKRKDVRVGELYETIAPKIRDTEMNLRLILAETVEKKNALKLQALHNLSRLTACIQYNREQIGVASQPLDELRSVVGCVSSEMSNVKGMIAFNTELLRQRNIETVSRGKSYIPWASRGAMLRPVSEQELNEDQDHVFLSEKLVALREFREQLVQNLSEALETRETFTSNLENSERCKAKLTEILNKDRVAPVIDEGANSESTLTFDHKLCTDCAYGITITIECTDHLMALNQQAIRASNRLQSLVEMRETIYEIVANAGVPNPNTPAPPS